MRRGHAVARAELEKRHRTRRRALMLAVLAPAAAAACYLAVGGSRSGYLRSLFTVKRVLVDCPALDPEPLYGLNMLTLSPAGVAGRLLAENPQVQRVEIRKLLPDTLVVSAARRVPFAWFYDADNVMRMVDRAGVILPGPADAVDLPALVELVGFPGGADFPGAVSRFARLCPLVDFARPVACHYGQNGYVLVTGSGGRIMVPHEPDPGRIDLLRRVLDDFERKGVTYYYIDLRFDRPVFMPDEETARRLRERRL